MSELRRDRRRFIGIAAAYAGGLCLPLFGTADAAERERRLSALLLQRFGSLESAREVGREYLSAQPDEADRRQLLRALAPPGGTFDVQRHVGEHHREDFLAGDTVWLRGWLLSRTEARLCALAALT